MDRTAPEYKIAIDHLSQLSQLQLLRDPSPTNRASPIDYADLDQIKQWITDHGISFQKGIGNRVYGGSRSETIHYENAFVAFIESCGMYLRDWDLVMDAVQLYKEHQRDEAVLKLKLSVRAIEDLAKYMGLGFQMLCDLSSSGWIWNGPFCGAFHSQDPKHPFVGVAFRGSSNLKDWLVDVRLKVVQAQTGFVHGTKVSKGVYESMFGHGHEGSAFDLIRGGVRQLVPKIPSETSNPIITHVTGHSLGGSYSSLCYVQFTEHNGLPEGTDLGDMYTFGSPRLGEREFVLALEQSATPKGRSWRLANNGDVVTKLPPPVPFLGWFKHLNSGISISKHGPPDLLPSEVNAAAGHEAAVIQLLEGVNVEAGWIPESVKDHLITSYYTAMDKVLSGPPPGELPE